MRACVRACVYVRVCVWYGMVCVCGRACACDHPQTLASGRQPVVCVS